MGAGGAGGFGPSCAELYDCAVGGPHFRYVDASAPNGGNGTKASPFQRVGDAIDSIGDGEAGTICVLEGTYHEHAGNDADTANDDRTFTLAGGFVAGSDYGVRDCALHPSTLQAPDVSAAALTFGNVRAITVDGFGITGGAHGIEIVAGYSAGRALRLLNNHIYQNGIDGASGHQGAGVLVSASDLHITNNLIEENHGGRLGAGIFVEEPSSSEQNELDPSTGDLVIGSALAVITGNVVKDNTLRHDTPHGVGIAVSMNAIIANNVVTGNQGFGVPGGGDAVGGGIFVQNALVTARIERNWVVNNSAPKGGGGIFIDEAAIAFIAGNVVARNVGMGAVLADGRASGGGASDRTYVTVVNNTIADNQGGGLFVEDATAHAYNNLFWNNGGPDLSLLQGGAIAEFIVADYNRLGMVAQAPGVTLGANNLGAAPSFADEAADDFHLLPGSPLANAGTSTFAPALSFMGAMTAPPSLAIDGAPRPLGPGYDLGAFEVE